MVAYMATREVPASIGQRLLWFLEHYRPDTTSLNCPVIVRLRGPLDPDALETALGRLGDRHHALRTTLERRGRKLVQIVHPNPRPDLTRLQITPGPDGLDVAIEAAVTEELQKPIDVSQWPVRTTLWRIDDNDHVLCINMHHLISDAMSCGIVMQELIKLLEAGEEGDPGLPEVQWQYSDYAQWQHDQHESGGLRRHQDYWINKLQGMTLVPLPPAGTHDPGEGGPSGVVTADIDAATFSALRQIGQRERTTVFTVLLSLYYMLLRQRTGASDLSVASLFANRTGSSVRNTVGFLANMVVLRTQLPESDRLIDVVSVAKRTVVEAFLHESIPYQMLPLKSQDTRGRVDDVVFQMLLTPPPGTKVSARGVEFELYTPDSLGSRFTLELGLIPQHDGSCKAMLFYARDRYTQSEARAMLDGYVALAADAAVPAAAVS